MTEPMRVAPTVHDLCCPLCRRIDRGPVGTLCYCEGRGSHMVVLEPGKRSAIETDRKRRAIADQEEGHPPVPRGL